MRQNAGVPEYEFDVAPSFAEEDRDRVLPIVERLKDLGVNVFYDEDRQVEMWGVDLVEYFSKTFTSRARFVLLFGSQNYVSAWARLQRRAAQARAVEEHTEYLLPIRLDDTPVPGQHQSTYLDLRVHPPEVIAQVVVQKLAQHRAEFTHRTPITPQAVAALVREKPRGWEYLLYVTVVSQGLDELEPKYWEHLLRYAPRNGEVEYGDGAEAIRKRNLLLNEIIKVAVGSVFTAEAQEAAFGPPGVAGDTNRIIHLGQLFVKVFDELLEWARNIHGTTYADINAREAAHSQARLADQHLQAMYGVAHGLRNVAGTLVERLTAGEQINMTVPLMFEVGPKREVELIRFLDHASGRISSSQNSLVAEFDYDVAMSFAGEDRSRVEPIVERLEALGVSVFYDANYAAALWGKNLVDHLPEIYGQRARYVFLFTSEHYVGETKYWTKIERQAVQARVLEQAEEVLLPIRLDDTSIPGLPSTVAYMDLRKHSEEVIAQALMWKLAKHRAQYNRPRSSQAEVRRLPPRL